MALANGPTGSGSIIGGAQAPQLTISHVTSSDQGSYSCVITSACGPVESMAATLSLDCRVDLTGDGQVDFFDVQQFLNYYSAGNLGADFVDDGVLDFFDVQAFLNQYSAGCP